MTSEQKPPRSGKPAVSPARRVAFDVLNRVALEGAFASVLLASQQGLSREDRSLAQEIALGVLRHQNTLDFYIEKYARRPIGKLDLPVLIALRMGLYQLRFLTRVPPSAAVNESVNLVKLARKTSAAALVNATLRHALRGHDESAGVGVPPVVEDALERLSVEVSHPAWLLARWRAAFGDDEARALAVANNSAPPVAFRVNTLRTSVEELMPALTAEGIDARPSNLAAGAFVVESGSATALAGFAESGLLYFQDEASQLVSLLLGAEPEDRILDLCAAPGSKTSHLAAVAGDRAHIVACDLYPHRLKTLLATCARLGIGSVAPLAVDATAELPFVAAAREFDRILVDAPCTGTGTLRRNPEIKWRLKPDDIPRLAGIQFTLLRRAAAVLAGGGRLVYSTCSVEREENEEVVGRFLQAHPGMKLVRPDLPLHTPEDCVTMEGFVRTFPHRHQSDGFFAAVLERGS